MAAATGRNRARPTLLLLAPSRPGRSVCAERPPACRRLPHVWHELGQTAALGRGPRRSPPLACVGVPAQRRLTHRGQGQLPPPAVATRLLMACAAVPRPPRQLMRLPRNTAAMAPHGPSRRRAVRASCATCRRGAPLGASFGVP